MSHDLGKYFAFINFYMNFLPGLLQNPPPWGTLSLVFNNTYNQQVCCKQNILPMELYNLDRCSIYNDHPAEKQTNMTT